LKVVKFNRTQYARDWKRVHHQAEQQAYPIFKAALDYQVKMVSDFVKAHGSSALASHLTVLVTPQPIGIAYEKVYKQAGIKGATFTYSKINHIAKGKSYSGFERKDSPGFFSEQWSKLMSLFYHTKAADRVTGVTDTTRDSIRTLLDDSADMPISQQATYITDQLDDPAFTRDRALRIARTETTTAANWGALLGGESSDYEVGKQWLAIEDANTRPDHSDADGQTVAIDETFAVGASQMSYPGDMSAPANEIVNCRCSLVVVPLADVNGLPILKNL
jgi:Tfp pilus assembly major pilin PilA